MNPSQSIEPRIEFTKIDFDRYRAKMAPYEAKSYDKRELLSNQEINALQEMKVELRTKFTLESLSNPQFGGYIAGYIDGIINFDELRKENIEEMSLGTEVKKIESQLYNQKKSKQLTPKERNELAKKRDELCYRLDPCHFH